MIYTYRYFSATYGTDAYGTGTYQDTAGTSTGTDPGTGPLANTGYDVIIPVALGLSIVIASVIVLVKKFRTKKQS